MEEGLEKIGRDIENALGRIDDLEVSFENFCDNACKYKDECPYDNALYARNCPASLFVDFLEVGIDTGPSVEIEDKE